MTSIYNPKQLEIFKDWPHYESHGISPRYSQLKQKENETTKFNPDDNGREELLSLHQDSLPKGSKKTTSKTRHFSNSSRTKSATKGHLEKVFSWSTNPGLQTNLF